MTRDKLAELLDETMKETTELDKKSRDRLNDALIDVLTEEADVTLDDEDDDVDAANEAD